MYDENDQLIEVDFEQEPEDTNCTKCYGTGENLKPNTKCRKCKGTGIILTTKN